MSLAPVINCTVTRCGEERRRDVKNNTRQHNQYTKHTRSRPKHTLNQHQLRSLACIICPLPRLPSNTPPPPPPLSQPTHLPVSVSPFSSYFFIYFVFSLFPSLPLHTCPFFTFSSSSIPVNSIPVSMSPSSPYFFLLYIFSLFLFPPSFPCLPFTYLPSHLPLTLNCLPFLFDSIFG